MENSEHINKGPSEDKNHEEFELEGNRGDSPFIVHVLAGSVAGLMEHVVIYPIDTIKVKKIKYTKS